MPADDGSHLYRDRRSGTTEYCHSSSSSAAPRFAAAVAPISRLDLYALSVVLSFLGECDGTSLLLTNRAYCRGVLPLFEVRQQALTVLQPSSSTSGRGEENGGGGLSTDSSGETNGQLRTTTANTTKDDGGFARCSAGAGTSSEKSSERVDDGRSEIGADRGGGDNRRRLRVARHRFRTMPMQDADVLLARLNSRRLRLRNVFLGRKTRESGVSSNDGVPRVGSPQEEKCLSELDAGVGNVGKKNGAGKRQLFSYRRNLSTEELAEWEHIHLGLLRPPCCNESSIDGVDDSGHRTVLDAHEEGRDPDSNCPCSIDGDDTTMIRYIRSLPPQLELLRFKRGASEVLPGWATEACSLPLGVDHGLQGCDVEDCSEGGNGCHGPSRPPSQLPVPTSGEPVATLLVSYPRSGNSLLRSLVERITGVATGTDTRPDRTLSRELATLHDMVGEGVTDVGRVHLVKTHFPERRGWKALNGHRVILLTRNPFDAIDSYFNMALTNTHTKTLTDGVYEHYQDVFHGMAKSEIGTWKRFHEHWFRSTGSRVVKAEKNLASLDVKVPMLVLRYEDLVTSPREAISRVISFMIGHPITRPNDALPPLWERRIICVLGGYSSKELHGSEEVAARSETNRLSYLGSYRPRSGGIGKSLEKGRFSPELVNEMHVIAGDILSCFGYNVLKQGFPSQMTTNSKFVMPRRNRVFFNCDDERINHSMSGVKINAGKELRGPDNRYGRKMTVWRKGQTDGDSKPMATIEQKDSL